GRDPPAAGVGLARLEPDEALAAAEGVRRAGHRLDRDAAPLNVRQPVAGENHQVREALVDPEGGPADARGGPAAVVSLQVGEAVVELRLPDRPRLAEIQAFVRNR